MTITEIAKLAGVSIGTVDRVLHNRGRVSMDTEERVKKIIKQYDYQPDPIARHLKKHIQYKIGVLFPSLTSGSGYWNKVFGGIENSVKTELSAFSFSLHPFFFDRKDSSTLEESFNALVASDCNAYIIAPVMQDKIRELLLSVQDIKPYCFLDSSIPDIEKELPRKKLPVCVIAQNPYKAGFLAGKLTQMIGNRKGTYIVLEMYGSAYNQNERARGFCSWFENINDKDCKAVHAVVNNSGDMKSEIEAEIKTELKKLLSEYKDIAGICTVSVEVQFVARLIAELGYKDITVTGFDLIDENVELLKDGKIDCLIDQKPAEQGKLALNQLYRKLVFEEKPENKIDIPIEIYFKENLS